MPQHKEADNRTSRLSNPDEVGAFLSTGPKRPLVQYGELRPKCFESFFGAFGQRISF